MSDAANPAPAYHALLIGIDAYSPKPLRGCVNDIDDITALLNEGIGDDNFTLDIRRLVAPTPPPDAVADGIVAGREQMLAELRRLGDEDTVKQGDRVLIYYSGHGSQQAWTPANTWHEALVPQDKSLLYDIEVNALIGDIARRTDDLTVILDCCHSGGATRGLPDDAPPDAEYRMLDSGDEPVEQPENLVSEAKDAGLFQDSQPPYLVVAACQADELAAELRFDDRRNGALTNALVSVIRDYEQSGRSRKEMRWAHIWPDLLDRVSARVKQNPWLAGRPERFVFGGNAEKRDPGFQVTRGADGVYQIAAGTLMGLTAGAELGVYGDTPAQFHVVNSDEDVQERAGRNLVVDNNPGRARCTAHAKEAPFDLPPGARARLIQPGKEEKLRVGLLNQEPDVVERLNQSHFLTVVAGDASEAEVKISGSSSDGWVIGNEIEKQVANVPAGDVDALAAGLEAYNLYQNVLRMASRCSDPQLSRCLSLQMLDGSNAAAIGQADPQRVDALIDELPEAPKWKGAYLLPSGFIFVVRVKNTYITTLYVTLFNCTAGGKVEYRGRVPINGGDSQVFWATADNPRIGAAYRARPGKQRASPTAPEVERTSATDRFIAIATTNPNIDLSPLQWDHTVQDVVYGLNDRDSDAVDATPPDGFWTSITVPVTIGEPEQ